MSQLGEQEQGATSQLPDDTPSLSKCQEYKMHASTSELASTNASNVSLADWAEFGGVPGGLEACAEPNSEKIILSELDHILLAPTPTHSLESIGLGRELISSYECDSKKSSRHISVSENPSGLSQIDLAKLSDSIIKLSQEQEEGREIVNIVFEEDQSSQLKHNNDEEKYKLVYTQEQEVNLQDYEQQNLLPSYNDYIKLSETFKSVHSSIVRDNIKEALESGQRVNNDNITKEGVDTIQDGEKQVQRSEQNISDTNIEVNTTNSINNTILLEGDNMVGDIGESQHNNQCSFCFDIIEEENTNANEKNNEELIEKSQENIIENNFDKIDNKYTDFKNIIENYFIKENQTPSLDRGIVVDDANQTPSLDRGIVIDDANDQRENDTNVNNETTKEVADCEIEKHVAQNSVLEEIDVEIPQNQNISTNLILNNNIIQDSSVSIETESNSVNNNPKSSACEIVWHVLDALTPPFRREKPVLSTEVSQAAEEVQQGDRTEKVVTINNKRVRDLATHLKQLIAREESIATHVEKEDGPVLLSIGRKTPVNDIRSLKKNLDLIPTNFRQTEYSSGRAARQPLYFQTGGSEIHGFPLRTIDEEAPLTTKSSYPLMSGLGCNICVKNLHFNFHPQQFGSVSLHVIKDDIFPRDCYNVKMEEERNVHWKKVDVPKKIRPGSSKNKKEIPKIDERSDKKLSEQNINRLEDVRAQISEQTLQSVLNLLDSDTTKTWDIKNWTKLQEHVNTMKCNAPRDEDEDTPVKNKPSLTTQKDENTVTNSEHKESENSNTQSENTQVVSKDVNNEKTPGDDIPTEKEKRGLDEKKSSLNAFTGIASRMSNSANICRICHCGSRSVPGLGSLVAPCRCRGSVALVHVTCLDRWLTESGADTCELCGFQFRTERIPRHTCLQSLMLWLSTGGNTKQLVFDLLWFTLMTPLAVISAYLLLLSLRVLMNAHDIPWTMVALLVSCGVTLAAYYGWVVGAVRFHARDWHHWWRTNYNVHVLSDAMEAFSPVQTETTPELRATERLLAVHSDLEERAE